MTRGLTGRGRAVLGAAVVLVVAGGLFGIRELYCVAAAAVAVVAAARLWVGTRRWDVEVDRHVHPARVPAGRDAKVELVVRNPGRWPTPPVEASDPFDGGRRWARFAVAPLEPQERRRSSYRMPATRRGVHHLGPLQLRVHDPFALAAGTVTTGSETSLTVHPAFELVPVRTALSQRAEGARQPQPALGRSGSEFHTLREYVPGDELRQVHWPSTARVGDLIIKQQEGLRQARVTVALDLRTAVHDGDTLEAAVSAAAGVAVSALHEGLQARVVTTAGFDSGAGDGRRQAPVILDGLAAASLHRPPPGSAPFRVASGPDPVVLVTTDLVSDADLAAAFELGGAAATTVVLFSTGRPGTSELAGRGRRVVRLAPGASFAAAWGGRGVDGC